MGITPQGNNFEWTYTRSLHTHEHMHVHVSTNEHAHIHRKGSKLTQQPASGFEDALMLSVFLSAAIAGLFLGVVSFPEKEGCFVYG